MLQGLDYDFYCCFGDYFVDGFVVVVSLDTYLQNVQVGYIWNKQHLVQRVEACADCGCFLDYFVAD